MVEHELTHKTARTFLFLSSAIIQWPTQPALPLLSSSSQQVVQGRVTDHRVGLTLHGLSAVIVEGQLDPFIDALSMDHQMKQLASLGTEDN